MEAMAHEEVWGTVTIMRTMMAKHLPGGVTQLTHLVLEQFHGDVHDILRAGVTCRFQGSDTTFKIFAKTQLIMADVPALAEMLSWKGHGAAKPCAKCMNGVHNKPPGGRTIVYITFDIKSNIKQV